MCVADHEKGVPRDAFPKPSRAGAVADPRGWDSAPRLVEFFSCPLPSAGLNEEPSAPFLQQWVLSPSPLQVPLERGHLQQWVFLPPAPFASAGWKGPGYLLPSFNPLLTKSTKHTCV